MRFDRWGLRAALAGLPPGTRQVILIEGRTTDGRRFEGRTSGRIGADREREDDDEDDRD